MQCENNLNFNAMLHCKLSLVIKIPTWEHLVVTWKAEGRVRAHRHARQPPEPHCPCDLIAIDRAQSSEDQNSWPTVGRSFVCFQRTAAASLSIQNLLCSFGGLRSRPPCSIKPVLVSPMTAAVSSCRSPSSHPHTAIPERPLGVASASHLPNHCHWIASHSTGR